MAPSSIDPARIDAILAFLQRAEALKDTLRSARTASGRPESTAEHCWRLCLLVLLFEDRLDGADLLRLLKLCLVHDLGEAVTGDIPATRQRPGDPRGLRERDGLHLLTRGLPDDLAGGLLALFDEYAAAETPEARLAKGFDKIETMLQHLIGRNADDFDWSFNLGYGRRETDAHPLLRLIRSAVDRETRARLEAARG